MTDTATRDELKIISPRNAMPGGKVLFNKRIEINLDQKLDIYCNGYSLAYAARDVVDEKSVIAFICDPAYPPRFRKTQAYAQVLNPVLPQLVSAGTVDLPGKAGQRLAYFYEDGIGKPVFTPQEGLPLAFGWRTERVLEKVVGPILLALKDLRDHDIVHGGIRLNNIFDSGKEKYSNVILGECLSSPASIAQPVLFEPLERALAMPAGRGAGMPQDDLYALGILSAILLRTKDPLKKKTDADIIVSKMTNGSYATVVSGDDHFSGSVLEFIRGSLIDDARQRWTLDEALTWLDGRRLSPKQTAKKKKAPRSLVFNGKNIFYPEFLARELLLFPNETALLCDTSDLEQWIERAVDDEEMVMRYLRAVKSSQDVGRGPNYPERLASRVAIALDPSAPVRYKNLAFTLDGLGGALGEAYIQGRDLATYAEMFSANHFQYYLSVMTELNYDVSAHTSKHDACKNYIKHGSLGFGLERILYTLNEDIQCLSPVVSRFYVKSPEDFLLALENILTDDKQVKSVLDRHSVAFLAAKDNKTIEPFLYEISSPLPFRQALGTLQVLASIQRYYRIPSVRHVAQWLMPQLDQVIERYHDKELRKELSERLAKMADVGDLNKILQLVDNQDQKQRDMLGFRRAIAEYRGLDIEKRDLLVKLQDPRRFKIYGRETAVIVAGVIGVLVILGFIMYHISGGRLV